jgi:hypothetical protein
MSEFLPPARRIVTGHDANGRSVFVSDGPAPKILSVAERPGYHVANFWSTKATPTPIDAPDDIAGHVGIGPPRNGNVLRVIDFPPEAADPEVRARAMRATFQSLYGDADHRPESGHPGMHITETVDYAIILEGEIVAILDEGETVMKAGDILVQRGTNHAWANRSGKPCRVCFVLIDGVR